MEVKRFKKFKNGIVYAIELEDGALIETTDTFLPFYTKDAIGRHQNLLDNYEISDRSERWMVGVSVMSGCPVRCRFCLLPDTKIMMSNFSTKNIQDIIIGDKVISNILTKASNNETSYSSKYFKSSDVLGLSKREYNDEIIIIKTAKNNIIKVTPNHRIAVYSNSTYRNKYIKSSDIKIGDKIISIENNDENISNNETWLKGWLYGFIKGDGVYYKMHKRKCYSTKVSQSDKKIIEFAHNLCDNFNIKTSNIWIYDNKINKLNYNFNFGEKANIEYEKLFTDNNNNINFKKGFMSGFWDAEGFSFSNNKNVRVCNTNIDLLDLFKNMVSELGFSANISKYDDLYVCNTNISRSTFLLRFKPIHEKRLYLNKNIKIKSLYRTEEVTDITKEKYNGYVYNFETTEHTYIANNLSVHNCATGQMKKWRNLTAQEIVDQVDFVVSQNKSYNPLDSKEFKVNYTRMGECGLNLDNVLNAIKIINVKYPNVHHYISTIGIKNCDFSWVKDNITLQVSLHATNEESRNWLIPYKDKMTIEELGQIRTESYLKTTINLTLVKEEDFDINVLKKYFDNDYFFVKISPINPNKNSNRYNLGDGIIEGKNLL